ncbi:MAG: hypothetical protein PHU21_14330 [Elusimicrobia bacterium]|nr:hypothetical protein [Elusimicrobiota bacterium]
MQPKEDLDQLWPRIAAAFLRPPARPTPVQTEAFVAKVMARLDEPAGGGAALLRWLTPAVSFALAASVGFMLLPAADRSEPAEALLLMSRPDSGVARLTALPGPPSADEVLALTLED